MKVEKEIREILERLKSRGKYRDIDSEKLLDLFRYSELAVPDELAAEDPSGAVRARAALAEKGRPLFQVSPVLRWVAVPALLVAAAVIYFTAGPFPGVRVKGGTIVSLAGKVEIVRSGTAIPLEAGMTVVPGDTLATGPGARVDLDFRRFIRMRVSAKSSVTVREARFTSGERRFEILVSRGTVVIHSDRAGENERVTILTPSSSAVVRGTIFGVTVYPERVSRYEVFEGKIKVRSRIDPSSPLDEREAAYIDEYLEEHAVMVGENQVCRVKPSDPGTVTGATIAERVRGLESPVIVTDRNEGFTMADELRGFIKKSGPTGDGAGLVSVRVVTYPDNANIYINGRKREHTGGEILIIPGLHDLTAEAPGYKPFEKKITVDEKSGTIRLKLDKKNTGTIESWITGLTASYLAYDSAMNYLVSIRKDGRVEATDMERLLWSVRLDHEVVSPPVVFHGVIYLLTSDNRLNAMAVQSGRVLWKAYITGAVDDTLSIVTDNTGLYIGTDQGRLYRLGLDGRQIWKAVFKEPVVTAPVLNRYMVYTALRGGTIVGVDRRSGVKVFRRKFPGAPVTSLAADNENIYFARGRVITGFGIMKDEPVWEYATSMSDIFHITAEMGRLFAYGRGGYIYSITTTGDFIWKTQLGNEIVNKPVMDTADLYIMCDQILFVIDREEGHVDWSLVIPPVLTGNLALSEDRMYFVSRDRGLISLKK